MILDSQKVQDMRYAEYLMKNPPVCVPSMLLFGEPGAGKTSFAKYLAEKLNAELIFAPCYDGVGMDELVYNWDLGKLVDAMTDPATPGRDALKEGYLLQALKLSNTKRVVLVLDEIDKAKPSVDTALLSYLQECMFNHPILGLVKGKKENLFVIMTSNKRRELEDALDRRFAIIREFKFPERGELIQQVKTMVSVDYNETKFMFLINLVLDYRNIKNIQKKPSQNQIADLIQELHFADVLQETKIISKKEAYTRKVTSLFWKLSQEESDHVLLKEYFVKKFSKTIGKDWEGYLGSML